MSLRSLLAETKAMTGLLLLVASAQFLVVMMVAEAVAPDYSMHENAISDLGVIDETRLFFNASMFAIGLLNLFAGFFFYKVHGSRVLYAMFVLGGIGAMGAAAIPLDSPIGIHGLFAFVAFFFINLEAITCVRLTKGPLKVMSLLAGATGIVFLVMMILVDSNAVDVSGSIGHGGTERLIAYPALLWMVAFGGNLLGDATSKRQTVA
ncbi:MAG: DUF998 domain-containing protein [Thermoplasmata archaeon]|nr:DUF998 domain-containing protein [Thermoplasmata archaeon]